MADKFASLAKKQTNELLTKLSKEPKVKMKVPKYFKAHFGDVLTFTFNGLPVTVYFNDTMQEFPQSIAQEIETKLSAFGDNMVELDITDEL